MTYDHVTTDMFDGALEGIVDAMTAGEILAVPGVYEVLSEALNNDVLSTFNDNGDDDNDDETHVPEIPDAPGQLPNVLPAEADVTPDYPTRCSECNRPTHVHAMFPGKRCLECHADTDPPMPASGAELARMWGATS